MTTIQQILDFFEGFAPLATAMDFDNCGLLVGDRETPVSKVLVTLDITAEVAEEAQQKGCELIISHHPVIFQPLRRMNSRSVPYLLAQAGISAVCMHTNLDLGERFGVNICLGQAAGLKEVHRASEGECLFVGKLENAVSARELAQRIMRNLDCSGLRYTEGKGSVRTVAVASGAGGSDIFAAAAIGADALITGEIKHHDINAANEYGVAVIDAGHFKSENVVINPLIARLKDAFPSVEFTKCQTYSDKMKYLSSLSN